MSTIGRGLERLRDAVDSGALGALCREHDVSLLVVFGSAIDPAVRQPRDLDVAARFDPYAPERVLPFLDAVAELAGTGAVDLMVLNTAGPVAREQALVYGELLYEAVPDAYAKAQIAASMERMDTDFLRRAQLEMLRTRP